MIAISVKDLFVSYHGQQALSGIDLSINSGNLIGIIGPNGAGKSTLLKAMLNLIRKDQGEIRLNERAVKEVRTKIAYVPQRSEIDWDFPITVLDAVLIGTYPNLRIFRRPGKREQALAYRCLEKVGMESYSRRQIGELSGGQQQRVFLARALAQNAEMYFLDEPFVGVDVGSEETIVRILTELRDAGKTIVVVHHDLAKAASYFDQIILLNRSLVGYGAVDAVLRPELLAKAYKGYFGFMGQIGEGSQWSLSMR